MPKAQAGAVKSGVARRIRRFTTLAVCTAVLCPLPGAGQSGPIRIHGQVLDARSGKPVAAALVRIAGAGATAETGSRGRFTLPGLAAGSHDIVVERLGYVTRTETVSVEVGQELDVTIRLDTRPIPLEPIAVEVRSGKLGEVGFYDRRDNSGLSGRYITAEHLERRNAAVLTDALVGVQGVKVFYTEPGRTTVRFNRYVHEQDGPNAGYAMQDRRDPRGCEPDLYIDGRLYRNSSPDLRPRNKVDDFNVVPVPEIAGVEIYVGAAVPVFVRSTACGVILIWTKR